MKFVWQSILLLSSFVLVFLWAASPFSKYSIQLVGLMIFFYILISARNRRKINFVNESPFAIFALNSVILLLIFQTGGLTSPLFFLLYFILFGIAFVFEANLVFVFAAGVIATFITQVFVGDTIINLLKVGSFIILSPMAYLVGTQTKFGVKSQQTVEDLKERTKESANTISKDVETVLKDQEENLPAEDVEKLNEVLEETEDLREEKKE